MNKTKEPELGRLVPPYPRITCTDSDCSKILNEDDGVYVFKDLETNKFVILCGDCAAYVELNCRQRFMLLPL